MPTVKYHCRPIGKKNTAVKITKQQKEMGRNKKKSNTAAAAETSSDDEHAPEPEVVNEEPQPTATASGTEGNSSSEHELYVEVFKTDKKKPSVMIKGLTARGLKLPAVASVLKRMVGAVDILKADDALEVAGDVVPLVISTLASKFDIPEAYLVPNAAAAMAAKAAKGNAPATAADPAKKQSGGGSDAESGAADSDDSDDDEDDDAMVVQRHGGVQVAYCPVCTFPAEMCEYSGMLEECKPWLLEQLDDDAEVERLANAEDKGRKRRMLTEAEKLDALLSGKSGKKVEQEVILESKTRVGRKKTTMIYGLHLFGVNLSEAAIQFKKQFACSVNVASGAGVQDHLDVQGDVVLQLLDLLPSKYNVPKSAIFMKDQDGKKQPCF